MADKVKGISIQIDADTVKFDEGISGTKKAMKLLKNEASNLNRQLKLDPNNVEKLNQKLKNLQQQEDVATKKVQQYKKQLSELGAEKYGSDEWVKLKTSINSAETDVVQIKSQITKTEQALKDLDNVDPNIDINNKDLDETKTKAKEAGNAADKMGKKFDSAADKIGNIGTKLTVVSTAIVAAAGVAVKGASDLNENINKSDVAFKDNSNEVIKWSETTIDNYGLSQNAALEAATTFGDMGTSMGLNTDEASKMSMSLTGLAGDLASFKNISSDQAMTALNGIFTGETESLKSLGIIMTETNLKQYALNEGYSKSYSEMSQAEKVQLRYNYVMSQTQNAQGDYLRTSDGFANSFRTLKGHVEQLGNKIGLLLLPTVEKITGKIEDFMKYLEGLDDDQLSLIVTIAAVVAAIGPVLIIISKVMKISSAIASLLGTIAAGPVLAIIAAIASIIAILVILYNNCEDFRKAVDDFIATVIPIFQQALANIVSFVQNSLIPVIQSVWDWLVSFIAPILTKLVNFVTQTLIPALSSIWDTIAGILLPILNSLWQLISEHVVPLWQSFAEVVGNIVIPMILQLYTWFADNVLPIILTVADTVGGVLAGAFDAVCTVLGTVCDIISTVIGWFQSLWGWLEDTGVIDGFADAFQVVADVIQTIVDSVKWLADNVGSIFSDIGDAVGEAADNVQDFVGWINPFDSGGMGTLVGGSGSLNLTTNINVNNNGSPISSATIRQWGNEITDVVDKNLYRRGRHR